MTSVGQINELFCHSKFAVAIKLQPISFSYSVAIALQADTV